MCNGKDLLRRLYSPGGLASGVELSAWPRMEYVPACITPLFTYDPLPLNDAIASSVVSVAVVDPGIGI